MKTPAVKQPLEKEDEVPTEIIASAIVAISEGIKKLAPGDLTTRLWCCLSSTRHRERKSASAISR